ncbi:MAG: DUF4340 domain-containing protein [Gammaproteobacteria bacterium]|nr:DUF4340 domain-containing protein [Gammaproteobacteria bacterium]
MSKRNLLNILLLIFTLALVAVIIFEPGKEKAFIPPTLTQLNADDIQTIKISRASIKTNESELLFRKTANKWQLIKPYQIPANTFRVDSILKLLSAVSLSQNTLNNLDLNKFGLDTPLATITFNDTSIIFGHNKSLKNHRYVKIDSTLHMIADTFYYQLIAKIESYIDHKLLPENSKIIKLLLPGIKLEQINGIWQSTPEADDFSADAVTQLIDEWQLSQAFDIEKIHPQPDSKADIMIYLHDKSISRFKIKPDQDSFTLINIDSGISYIIAKDRRNKLLHLSGIEQND